MASIVKGAVPSPNIWNTPPVYELENHAVDPDRRVEIGHAGAAPLGWGDGPGHRLRNRLPPARPGRRGRHA